jgi:hypothetical protein
MLVLARLFRQPVAPVGDPAGPDGGEGRGRPGFQQIDAGNVHLPEDGEPISKRVLRAGVRNADHRKSPSYEDLFLMPEVEGVAIAQTHAERDEGSGVEQRLYVFRGEHGSPLLDSWARISS